MVERVPFTPAHAARIRLQPRQLEAAGYASVDHYRKLAATPSIALLDGHNVLMCGGAFEIWPGRAVAWALLAESIGHRMTACVRHVRRFFDEINAPRVEMDVAVDHEEGHRFARLLGFELETPRARVYYPDGSDAAIYVRVRHD
jgi:hypothetical protein